ncbi:AAA family ATPase [Saccharothrix obliqua]|uniref:AAA family ATPase n=1 Tax=Saccharothrix obliqua TaxID=2861747 RepID=UPI001C5FD910|nr:ATP-binding protein [Saccharothrix obliqua]MBW4719462.1 ATP-binding protein [Saccharothrix obliqua]
MLIRFEVANFRSILDPVELSLVAVDRDRPEARPAPNIGESLLPVAAIFGPNASGKSNVITALHWLRDAVVHSLRFWEDRIPVDTFAFGDGRRQTSEFVLEAIVQGVRFEYVLELDKTRVHYEGLFHYPEKKRRRVFEREGETLKLQRGLSGLSGTRELLTPRTLVLAVARRFEEPLVNGFAAVLRNTQVLAPWPTGRRSTHNPTAWWFGLDPDQAPSSLPGADDTSREDRAQALAMLRMADLGIDDVVIDSEEMPFPGDDVPPGVGRTRRRIRFVHRSDDALVPLDLHQESEGTRTWYRLIGPVLSALRLGSPLLFDELDASLHPTLSAQLIRLFHDRVTNPLGAQLIFTSHDTSLLNHLNRDEVRLTEELPNGTTRLGALADFAGERVRRSQNLENAYLHGRFGALPDVDRTAVLRVLGLIG